MRVQTKRSIATAFTGVLLASFAANLGATIVGSDDFESYDDQNPAVSPLVGPELTWDYIDGLGNGILTNEHRIFTGTGAYAPWTTGWMSRENGGGISTSISLSSLAGTPYDAGGGNIIANAAFKLTLGFIAPYTTDVLRTCDFTYDIAASGGVLTFQSGGSMDAEHEVVFDSLNDSGWSAGGADATHGKTDRRRFEVNFQATGLKLADTLEFSIVRDTATSAAFMFFDDFQVEALDGIASDMVLSVDRSSGNITMVNATINSVNNIVGYSLLSEAGSLLQANWDRQSTGSQLASDNDQWTVLTGAGVTTDLSEAVLATSGDGNGGNLISVSGAWDFGEVWSRTPFEDVQLEILLDDGTVLSTAAGDMLIEYTGDAVAVGDIAGPGNTGPDGTIDLVDWLEFRGNVGTDVSALSLAEAYQRGDLNEDLAIDAGDYILFVSAYDAANGAGAFQAMVAQVPEPTAGVLVAFGMGLIVFSRSRNRCAAQR